MAKEKTATIISVEYIVVYFNRAKRTMSEDISVFVPYGTPDKRLNAYFMEQKPADYDGIAFANMSGKARRDLRAITMEDFMAHSRVKKSELVDLKDIKPDEEE